jgi:hypothetical protein
MPRCRSTRYWLAPLVLGIAGLLGGAATGRTFAANDADPQVANPQLIAAAREARQVIAVID